AAVAQLDDRRRTRDGPRGRWRGRCRRDAADRSRCQLRLCVRLSARHPERIDERKLSNGRRGRQRVRCRDSALPTTQRLTEPATARTIVLSANSDWNIANFRQGLIHALRSAGYEPVVIAPQEPAADKRMRDLGVERIAI